MRQKSTRTGLLLIALAAIVGAALIWLPPKVIELYRDVRELSPAGATAYLVAVGLGAVLLSAASLWILVRLWLNTRRKQRRDERRGRDPSQLTPAEREAELRENIASGGGYAEGEHVPAEVRAEIRAATAKLESRLDAQSLEIVAFGTISSGKSSLLNALAGRDIFRTDARGGTTLNRTEVPWPGEDRVTLVDTPGLAEVAGEQRAAQAAQAAKDADLVLFVVDGPLKAYEVDLLRQLAGMEKRTIICLNKQDWFSPDEREELLGQIRGQAAPLVAAEDIVTVQAGRASRQRMRVLPDGTQAEESVPLHPDITPLAERMTKIVAGSRRDLLLSNLLLQSRGLIEQAKERARESLDRRADELISRYMWAAGGAAAVNPIPLLDLAGGSAVTVKMVLDLAKVYRQDVDTDLAVELLANLSKNLIAMLGATAAAPAIAAVVASMIKTVPGIGTIAGGMVQGVVQALMTRWIGKVFQAYFRADMQAPRGGMAELARAKWEEVTRPEQLVKLVQAGRKKLREGLED